MFSDDPLGRRRIQGDASFKLIFQDEKQILPEMQRKLCDACGPKRRHAGHKRAAIVAAPRDSNPDMLIQSYRDQIP
jgi:hypothetical protein